MRKLIVTLLVLAVLFGLADRGLKYLAERAVSQQLASNYQISGSPDVNAHGFPFITQVVAGDYDQIDITIDKVTKDGIEIDDLDASMHDVHASLMDMVGHNARKVTAGEAEGTATIPYLSIDKQLPSGLRLQQHGSKLEAVGKVHIAGFDLPVKAYLKLGISRSGVITAKASKVKIGHGRVPASLVKKRLHFHLPLVGLPMNLHLTAVQPGRDGLHVTAHASNVVFTQATG